MSRVGAIVQARVGSRRLPGKTLRPILGRPMIAYVMDQVRAARQLDTVILATSDRPQDDPLAELCTARGWETFRGSEEDVLDRFYRAAIAHRLDAIVRITGDCPLKDPEIVDWAVATFREQGDVDYLATSLEPRLPVGMDVDMFSTSALERAWRHAVLPSEREHVNPFFRKHPERFRHRSLIYPRDLTGYRLAVDEPEDLLVVQRIIESLYVPGRPFKLQEVVNFLERNPEVVRINARLVRDQGYIESLKGDLEALDLGIPGHLAPGERRQYAAREISNWMGKPVECAEVVVQECPAGAAVEFEVILRGEILDTIEADEVRVPLRARLEGAEAFVQPQEPARSP